MFTTAGTRGRGVFQRGDVSLKSNEVSGRIFFSFLFFSLLSKTLVNRTTKVENALHDTTVAVQQERGIETLAQRLLAVQTTDAKFLAERRRRHRGHSGQCRGRRCGEERRLVHHGP